MSFSNRAPSTSNSFNRSASPAFIPPYREEPPMPRRLRDLMVPAHPIKLPAASKKPVTPSQHADDSIRRMPPPLPCHDPAPPSPKRASESHHTWTTTPGSAQIGFMVTGLMAILAVPTGAMPVIFGSFPGEPIVTAAQRQERLILIIGGVAFLVAGVLCALTAIRLRPRAPEGGPP